MKIVQSFIFIVILIQLSQVFAAPENSPDSPRDSSSDDSQSIEPHIILIPQNNNSPPRPRNQPENPTRFVSNNLLDFVRQSLNREFENFNKWNKYLKEYVCENIPKIVQNKAIRDYLLRVEHWATSELKLQFAYDCDIEQFNRELRPGRQPVPLTDVQCRKLAYDTLKIAMDKEYLNLGNYYRIERLVNETATLIEFRVNKFLVFKTLQAQEHQLFDEQKLPRNPENFKKSRLDTIAFIKEHYEALPCPYDYQQ